MGDVFGTAVKHQIVPESAFLTPGANGEQINVVRQGVTPNEAREVDQTLAGFRAQPRSVPGARNAPGPILVNIAPEDIGIMLKHLIGAPTTTGAGPYTHVFQPALSGANALPIGFTLQSDYGTAIASASRFMRVRGCRINQGAFSLSPTGFQSLQLDVVGSDFGLSNTDLDSTPVLRGHQAFDGTELSIVVGGVAPKSIKFASFAFTVSNDLDQDKRAIGNGGVRVGMPEGFFMVTGQAVAFFDHEDTINQVMSGTDTEIDITLSRGNGLGTAGNESMVIHIGDLVCERNAPPVEGPRGLRVPFNFTAHRVGAAEIDFLVTLKNAVATIT